MHLMLNPYRRHAADCPHRKKGRAHRQCKCPVWVQGTIGGAPVRQSLDTRDWKTAQDRIHAMELIGKVERSGTVKQVVAEFIADCRARKLSAGTMRKYHSLLVSQDCSSLSVRFAGQTIREIEAHALMAWRAEWGDAGITQQKKLERLRVFWRWCIAAGYTSTNAAEGVKAPKVRQVPTLPFTRDEVAKLVASAPHQGTKQEGLRLRAYLLVCRYTGLRRGDAAGLSVDALRGNRLLLRQEKTGEPLYTVLPPHVVEALRDVPRLSERHWFWTGQSKLEVVGGNYGRSFRRLCEKCGIENGHLHRLRDTFAVELLNAGTAIEVVSRLLGHASVRITERHYSPWVRSRQVMLEQAMERAWAMDLEGSTREGRGLEHGITTQ